MSQYTNNSFINEIGFKTYIVVPSILIGTQNSFLEKIIPIRTQLQRSINGLKTPFRIFKKIFRKVQTIFFKISYFKKELEMVKNLATYWDTKPLPIGTPQQPIRTQGAFYFFSNLLRHTLKMFTEF